jgi:outer membrane lipoprotein-sorting protein
VGASLAFLLVIGLAGAALAAGEIAATRSLVRKLSAAGRGQAMFTMTQTDPMGGPDVVQRGRIALEPPDRVRLDFNPTGERIAVRGDGGEWIQPSARQMVRLGREQAGVASWLWEVFLQGGTTGFTERTRGPGRYLLTPRDRDAGLPEGITVLVDARGLPAEIEYTEGGGAVTRYRFRSWRFMRPQGPRGFILAAPGGYATVDLP